MRCELDGAEIRTPDDFYDQLTERAPEIVPSYFGRNLDALWDILRDLTEPLTIVWNDSALSSKELGEWFGRVLATLVERDESQPQPVYVELR